MKVLPKNNIEKVLDRLAEKGETYVPVTKGITSEFALWSPDTREYLDLGSLNTVLSPKPVVLPQTEKMYTFAVVGQEAEVTAVCEQPGSRAIFGIRACDSKALAALDLVFLTRGYEDGFYRARRQGLTVIARACTKPGLNCFCEAMGVSPLEPEASDVILYDLADGGFAWEAKTEKGEELTRDLGDLLTEGNFSKPEKTDFSGNARSEGIAQKLATMFEHPIWEELAAPCMNCGICTYLCPSCYCFDIQVKTRGSEGYRFRCWDSCMYPEYTQMAGGHNPRERKQDRFRNRFLHKLEFFCERYGTFLCTGCGRCIVFCPQGINILSIMNRLQEVGADVR